MQLFLQCFVHEQCERNGKNMGNLEKDIDVDDVKELIEKYFRLQEQIDNPTRDGMINALANARSIAYDEIIALEMSEGEIERRPWSDLQDFELYSKLPQYKQGLYNHAVNKVGEETFKYMLEECI